MRKHKDQCARYPYYFALYGTVGILIRNCCLHLIDYPIAFNLKESHDKLVYTRANLSNLTTFHLPVIVLSCVCKL